MLDDDGKEVPGTKGYKYVVPSPFELVQPGLTCHFRYFGRAKDLPGVRELFQSRKNEEEEENKTFAYYKKYMNQGPEYYGDLDEVDGKLLAYEKEAEEEGEELSFVLCNSSVSEVRRNADWEEAYINLREVLGLPADSPIPKIPRPETTAHVTISESDNPPPSSKRKAGSEEEDVDMEAGGEETKKAKTTAVVTASSGAAAPLDGDAARLHAQTAAAYIPFLDVEHLMPPKLPTHEEIENVLLVLRKKALVEEYFGGET